MTMFLMAMLLISSMAFREYAHFIDHAHHFQGLPSETHSSLDHDAKFHYLTEAVLAFAIPGMHQKVVAIVAPLSAKDISSVPHLLPPNRAPPVSI